MKKAGQQMRNVNLTAVGVIATLLVALATSAHPAASEPAPGIPKPAAAARPLAPGAQAPAPGAHDAKPAHAMTASPAPNLPAQAPAGPAPSPSPTVTVEPIAPVVAKKVLPEFLRAQISELKALEHRQKLELKELKASQSARQKDWDRQERDARHRYFGEHQRGPDRRAYIKEFMERGRAFRQMLADELKSRAQEQEARTSALKSEQAQRLKEFKDSLDKGVRPPASLWPSAS